LIKRIDRTFIGRNRLWQSRELMWNLSLRELRTRYRKSFLGWFWSLLNPLSTVAIYSFVFGILFKATAPPGDPSGLTVFALYMLSALLPWSFFGLVTNLGMNSLLSYAGMVKKVAIEREVIVYSQVIFGLVQHSIEMSLLVIVLLIVGSPLLPWIPVTVLMMLLLGSFSAGIALCLSVWAVYFRDLNYLWGVLLQMWFFATPIVYDPSLLNGRVPEWVITIHDWNPMNVFVRSFRHTMYDGRGPRAVDFLAMLLFATGSLLAGRFFFRRGTRRLAEEL
jgi:ABC-type polysaccharide/polyol phosphate export permease